MSKNLIYVWSDFIQFLLGSKLYALVNVSAYDKVVTNVNERTDLFKSMYIVRDTPNNCDNVNYFVAVDRYGLVNSIFD